MENVLVERDGGIATITVNRPKALNALNTQTLDELKEAFTTLDEDVRVVILTGAGEKSFVAGADIVEMSKLDALQGREHARKGHELCSLIEKSPRVVIGAINGFALGGGNELAMACDIRIGSTKAKFGQPEVGLGIPPGFGGTQRLPRLVGKSIAKEIIFTGDMIDAQEAYRIGLINKVCEPDKLMARAKEMAEKILTRSFNAVKVAKRGIDNGMNMDDESAFFYEAELFGICFATEDQKEGMSAFIEKREPNFK